MNRNPFELSEVRLVIGTFDPSVFKPGRSYVTEISRDGILQYEKEPGSQKQIDKFINRDVSVSDIDNFFRELFEFSRNISEESLTIDDCSYTVTFIYSSFHKEIFKGWCGNESTCLHNMIKQFVNKCNN